MTVSQLPDVVDLEESESDAPLLLTELELVVRCKAMRIQDLNKRKTLIYYFVILLTSSSSCSSSASDGGTCTWCTSSVSMSKLV